MKPINFPVFLIEYNQSKTNGWVNKYVNAEDFKFLFLNKHNEIDTSEISKNCSTYDELYQFISKKFETPSEFLEEKLSEIHKNIQKNLDQINQMKAKIEGSDDESEKTKIGLDTESIKTMASEIQSSKNNVNNKFKQVGSEEDPLSPYPSSPYPSSSTHEDLDDKDSNNNHSPLPAHLNNSSLWGDSSTEFDKYSGSSSKIRFSSSSAKITKRSKHRYRASVSNPNVQKEFWKNSFYEAERENLELCLIEKYAFSHRRLLENIIKAIEILFKYYPTLFHTKNNDSTITTTTPLNESESSTDRASVKRTTDHTVSYEAKTKFISRVEKEIWPKLWISKSNINICLLKLSQVYDDIRNSEKLYLEKNQQNLENLNEEKSEIDSRYSDFYKQSDLNASESSLQGLLDHDKEGREEEGNDNDNNNNSDNNRTRNPSPKKKNVDDKSFVRKSIKYWIHPDYVTEVKAIILRHLPIYVFGGNPDLDHPKNPLISSVYYDNHELELYHHRLHKSHLAIAFRYRWYGKLNWNHQMSESEYEAYQASGNKSEVFAERKTHKEDWTGENSVKERFTIDPSKINAYNCGQYVVEANDSIAGKRPSSNKSSSKATKGKEVEDEDYYKKQEKLMAKVTLAREIQSTIMERQLRPTMRTIYNRTAFQLPDDQRVRVSLDTELTFVREDLKAKKGEWKRDDVGMQWPYRHLKNSEKCLFPYAVLEVKLQTQFGQEPPQWINELTTSYLVQPVPKFSKFMHGCAMLIPEKVKINPYWFYRMYETSFDLRYPLNVATLRETSMCPVKMPWNMGSVITNFDFISPTLRRCISSRSNNIQRPTRREPKLSFANERLFLKYFKIGILVCNVSTVIYYYGNPIFGISYTFAGLVFIIFGYYIYRWRENRIQHNPNSLPLDSIPSIYVIASVLVILFIFNLINIFSGRYSTSNPAKLHHIQNNNVITHRY